MEKWYVAAKRADFNKWAEEFGISPVLARILRNRELTEEAEIRKFLWHPRHCHGSPRGAGPAGEKCGWEGSP